MFRKGARTTTLHCRVSGPCYFFFAGLKSGCQTASLRLGAAAITLVFSLFGFLASRLPRCWPFAMSLYFSGLSSSSSSGCRTRPRGVQTLTSM